jgi:ComF family protein
MKQFTKRIETIFLHILSTLFPYSPDEQVLALCDDTQFITYYQPVLTSGVWTLLPYSNKTVRSAVHLCKFKHHPRATTLLGTILRTYLLSLDTDTQFIIIPMPLSAKRYRERGYNQVENIVRSACANIPHIYVQTNLLFKTKHTAPQVSLKRAERLKNVQGAFTCTKHPSKQMRHAHIILIDDVHTTGSTLKSAHTALKSLSPRSITCVALAH